MASWPPATMQSASPALMACEASMTALSPEPQTLLMVSAGMAGGKAGVNQGLPGGSLARAALHHLPHDDLIHAAGLDPGARDGLADDHGSELGSGK